MKMRCWAGWRGLSLSLLVIFILNSQLISAQSRFRAPKDKNKVPILADNNAVVSIEGTRKCGPLPRQPVNGIIKCYQGGMTCMVQCNSGLRFGPPFSGRSHALIECKGGQWTALVGGQSAIPQRCDPPALRCPVGQKTDPCGRNTCKFTCFGVSGATPCQSKCAPGCVCPQGFLKNPEGLCVPLEECPCLVNDERKEAGERELKKLANGLTESCSCAKGKWECRSLSDGLASVWGNMHFTTVDGRTFNFRGKCDYALQYTRNLYVTALTEPCVITSDGVRFVEGSDDGGCLKELNIASLASNLRLLQGRNALINGKMITKFPHVAEDVTITKTSAMIVASFTSEIEIQWDGVNSAFFKLDETNYDLTKGLLGKFNGDASDDLHNDDYFSYLETDEEFANSWKLDDACDDEPAFISPCVLTPRNKSDELCGKIHQELFKPCHKILPPESFYEACKSDICSCKDDGSVEPTFCNALASYAQQCALKGAVIEWRKQIKECEVKCPGNQVYSTCGKSCTPTCEEASSDSKSGCSSLCVPGCTCPPNTVLDRRGQCVPASQCPCTENGVDYAHGTVNSKRKGQTNDADICTCEGGKWTCVAGKWAEGSAWGDPHYTSFDGKKFDFMGKHRYYLLQQDDFIVEQENFACGSSVTCTKSLTVRTEGLTIHLLPGRKVKVNGKEVPLPFEKNGVSVTSISSSQIQVTLPSAVQVKFDGVYDVRVRVPPYMFGKTKGLFGNFNGNPADDFTTPDGTIAPDPNTFGHSFATDPSKLPPMFEPHPCEKFPEKQQPALAHCAKLSSSVFSACHAKVKAEEHLEDCRLELCACKDTPGKCACNVYNSYAKLCLRENVTIDWRNNFDDCKIPCPAGQVYQVCGDSCAHSCRDITANPNCKTECADGCNCPKGLTLDDNNKCIPIEQCPCEWQGNSYIGGSKVNRVDKNTGVSERCFCRNGRWSCAPQRSASCTVWGDPHYTTFDGHKFNYMGQCSYYLVKYHDFWIEVEHTDCKAGTTCVKTVIVTVQKFYGDIKIELLPTLKIQVNGELVDKLPLERRDYTIRKVSESQVLVALKNGVQITWDGINRVEINAPGTFFDLVDGLCGNFNGDPGDDFMTPSEKKTSSPIEFGDSWRVEGSCMQGDGRTQTPTVTDTCKTDAKKKAVADKLCGKMKEPVFAACHDAVKSDTVIADCILDTCAVEEGQENTVACKAMDMYADECAKKGLLINFKNQVTECNSSCPPGLEYQQCGDVCTRTCKDVTTRKECKNRCISGCNCPPGTSLEFEGGTCIRMDECPCIYNDEIYETFETIVQTINGKEQLCTCTKAEWQCEVQPPARCTIISSAHVMTFDGTKLTVDGKCGLQLLKARDTSISTSAEDCLNKVCPIQSVIVKHGSTVVTIQTNMDVFFNGLKVTQLPFQQRGITLRKSSEQFLTVRLPNEIQLTWNFDKIIYIDVPTRFYMATVGICGIYDGDPSDDMINESGHHTISETEFVKAWRQNKNCQTRSGKDLQCIITPKIRAVTERMCSSLRKPPFTECHGLVDVAPFLESCELEACRCGSACTCPFLEVYATQCARMGHLIDWKNIVSHCRTRCPAGQTYQVCGDSCSRTCSDLQKENIATCRSTCVAGCTCPPGKILLDDGSCAEIEACPCRFEDKEYTQGSTRILKDDAGSHICTCGGGMWKCEKQTQVISQCSVERNLRISTFDGLMLEIPSPQCQYEILKYNNISIRSTGVDCSNQGYCYQSIIIEYGSNFLRLNGGKKSSIVHNGDVVKLPFMKDGTSIMEDGNELIAVNVFSDIKLSWDQSTRFYIEANPATFEKIKGLCGNFNNERHDDMVTRDGTLAQEANKFLSSWRTADTCVETKVPPSACDKDPNLKAKAETQCSVIKQRVFAGCREVLEAATYYENCIDAVCRCPGSNCECAAISTYASACRSLDIAVEWRTRTPQCAMTCPTDQVYKACGNPCTRSCLTMAGQSTCNGRCTEGCFCKPGLTLDNNGKCVPSAQCECFHNGKTYALGESVVRSREQLGLEKCYCGAGAEWICVPVKTSPCMNVGLDQYLTFDGKSFTFQANCRYYLVQSDSLTVELTTLPCTPTLENKLPAGPVLHTTQAPDTDNKRCTKEVTVRVGIQTVSFGQERHVRFNDEVFRYETLPKTSQDISIRRANGDTIVASTSDGVDIFLDSNANIRVDLPPKYFGVTKGLCGTFTGNSTDDFSLPDNEVAQNIQEFVSSWQVAEKCAVTPTSFESACEKDEALMQLAKEKCALLISDLFAACQEQVEVEGWYSMCLQESCACGKNKKHCECSTITAYAAACWDTGIQIDWQGKMPHCGMSCPNGQVMQTCGSSCGATCNDLAATENCREKCLPGCGCPKGKVLDEQGVCIPVQECGCQLPDGKQLIAGQQILRQKTKSHGMTTGAAVAEFCQCNAGRLECESASVEAVLATCQPDSIFTKFKNLNALK